MSYCCIVSRCVGNRNNVDEGAARIVFKRHLGTSLHEQCQFRTAFSPFFSNYTSFSVQWMHSGKMNTMGGGGDNF